MKQKRRLSVVQMIEEYQCPGCMHGSDTKCGSYKLTESYGATCSGHYGGTRMMPGGRLALGLPKGFNRYGGYAVGSKQEQVDSHFYLHFWDKDIPPFDNFNVPVWKLEQDGMLFVRAMSPRTNVSTVHVIQLGDRPAKDVAPNAIDVASFHDDMD